MMGPGIRGETVFFFFFFSFLFFAFTFLGTPETVPPQTVIRVKCSNYQIINVSSQG